MHTGKTGRLELLFGSMFSGKSEALLSRLKRAQIAKQNILLFKPRVDNRYSADQVVSHNKQESPAIVIDCAEEIFKHINSPYHVIGIDEAQFFDLNLVKVCRQLADNGHRVIVAGLDQTFEGQAFGPIPFLACEADETVKLKAICVRCGNLAHRSHKLTKNKDKIELGADNVYEPLCRRCYNQQLKIRDSR